MIALGDRYLRERGLRRRGAAPELDRRRGVPPRLPRAARRLLRAVPRPARRGLPRRAWRRTRCGCSTARSTARRTSCSRAPTIADHLCEPCAAHFAAVRAGLDEAGVALRARSAAGARPRLLHAHGVRVGLGRADAENKAGTVNAGGRYDGLAEALGGQPTPGVGFAMGLDRVLLAMEAEGVAAAAAARAALLRRRDRGRGASAAGRRLVDELRDRRDPGGAGVRGTAAEGPAEDGRPRGRRVRRRSSGSASSPSGYGHRCDASSTACRSRSRSARCRRLAHATRRTGSDEAMTERHANDDANPRVRRAARRATPGPR